MIFERLAGKAFGSSAVQSSRHCSCTRGPAGSLQAVVVLMLEKEVIICATNYLHVLYKTKIGLKGGSFEADSTPDSAAVSSLTCPIAPNTLKAVSLEASNQHPERHFDDLTAPRSSAP